MPDLPKSKLQGLFAAVHDQVATHDEIQLLNRWLHNNSHGQRQYVDYIDTMQEIEHQVGTMTPDKVGNRELPSKAPAASKWLPFDLSARIGVLATAASLLAILGVTYLFINWKSNTVVAHSESSIEAIVTASFDGKASFDGNEVHSGSAVGAGLLQLATGKINVRLESGVELSLGAPAEIEVQNSQQVELLSGSLTAEVPDEVIGFTVKMPGLNVVDLGTTFGVHLSSDGRPKVHVFDGVVDAKVESNQTTVRLTDKQTISFDGEQVSATAFDENLFVEPNQGQQQDPTTSGDVRFLQTPPKSVEIGQFEHDLILCFREKNSSTLLEEDLSLSFGDPGHYHVYPRWQDSGSIPAGTSIDSYFVHLDAIGGKKRPRQGTISFDRPILGVVFSRQLILQQNELLGDPRTVYAPDRPQSKLSTTLENESVTLSADRRTIRFRWFIRALSDQVRILLASDNNSSL